MWRNDIRSAYVESILQLSKAYSFRWRLALCTRDQILMQVYTLKGAAVWALKNARRYQREVEGMRLRITSQGTPGTLKCQVLARFGLSSRPPPIVHVSIVNQSIMSS